MDLTNVYCADFETTVYKGQKSTQVWGAGICRVGEEEVTITNSIEKFFDIIKEIKGSIKIYFHNVKFDGSFILNYMLSNPDIYKHGVYNIIEGGKLKTVFKKRMYMSNGEFTYLISDKGQFYNILYKQNNRFIEFIDSAKLLPASVSDIAKAYGEGLEKGTIDYKKIRYPGWNITKEEEKYLKMDIIIMSKALCKFLTDGHNKMTIGSCAMQEFKNCDYFLFRNLKYSNSFRLNTNRQKKEVFMEMFPDLQNTDSPFAENSWDYVHKSYKGAWCYVNKYKKGKVLKKLGLTADINSLYPYVMHSMSGNYYPIGLPTYFKGAPDFELLKNYYWFITFKCSFRLKDGYLPTIQIKNNWLYNPREFLETSEPSFGGKKVKEIWKDGEVITDVVELTMTMTDFSLFLEHYNIDNMEYIGGCYFNKEKGIFDEYINKWRKIKENSTGIERLIAKLFQNSLYGKFATSPDSSYKVCYLQDGVLKFKTVVEKDKKPGYIPIGSAITSYARDYTIRRAQANYNKDKEGFCYADTDSLHCDYDDISKLKMCDIHSSKYGCFKIETIWEEAIFSKAKAYIEKIIEKDGKPCNDILITCAGMSKGAKNSLKRWVRKKRVGLGIFKQGLRVPDNLKSRQIVGGILLSEEEFVIRK